MINKLINEIDTALKNELYLVALNSALILPDICGKAEYKTDNIKERYTNWYNTYVVNYKTTNVSDEALTGEVVYDLRCSLLHQGDPNLNKKHKTIDSFELTTKNNNYNILIDMFVCSIHEDKSKTYSCNINIQSLCNEICKKAKLYYEQNRQKFNFINYTINEYKR